MNRKDILRYVLKIVVQKFETHATPEQIKIFKQKYSGVDWQKTIEKDLLRYATTAIAMKRWISNVVSFMQENEIARE